LRNIIDIVEGGVSDKKRKVETKKTGVTAIAEFP
jgi:hypothetical protein